MKLIASIALSSLMLLNAATVARAHCEVPCGIYGDQRRYESMLEDQATIAKAMAQIADLSGKTDAQSQNQLVRWITTKEAHATKIQETIAQYFMAQRIKSANENYTDSLTKAHGVIVAAMKTKQNVDPEVAEALRKSILAFYKAQEGKEPHLHP